MCLMVLDWRPDDAIPLLLVANRDEFRARPTRPMHWWPADAGAEEILAGRDLKAGGTWLALDRAGRFALLTNIRPGYLGKTSQRSRGELPLAFLNDGADIDRFHRRIQTDLSDYGGFNLVLGDGERLFWFSSDHPEGRWLAPGVHALSNHALDTPWPKTEAARRQMVAHRDRLADGDFGVPILTDRAPAPDDHLPDTGVPLDWERQLSAQTITGETYGTRCRTWIRMAGTGEMDVCEAQLDEQGEESGRLTFNWVRPNRRHTES